MIQTCIITLSCMLLWSCMAISLFFATFNRIASLKNGLLFDCIPLCLIGLISILRNCSIGYIKTLNEKRKEYFEGYFDCSCFFKLHSKVNLLSKNLNSVNLKPCKPQFLLQLQQAILSGNLIKRYLYQWKGNLFSLTIPKFQ